MYAIMGVTGQVGGAAAEALLAEGKKVRAIVRNEEKAKAWHERGAETAIADYRDSAALQEAFTGVKGVFVMNPPYFYPEDGFPETRAVAESIRRALEAAAPPKFVALSSVGAHRDHGLGIIESLHILEQELGRLSIPSAFLRAAWFMDNSFWDIEPARREGQIPVFLSPSDRKIPMISTLDIGRIAAETLQQSWEGTRYLELQGPDSYSPDDIASVLGRLLDRKVEAVSIPRADWDELFISQGGIAGRIHGRIEMLDGFNNGWIDFKRQGTELVSGSVTLEESLKKLM
ncbi:NmrA family NAD(P)-binding protein [Paenibacillus sepulcri]|uniref:NmrA family NAD(P)-binding protein n=1 Tax=Paenibacillus sepulcri TaxID=359917 RepID=A0ABS7C719_9BACL|nr:NmrA family NAD(P)-binding protein [Paenibacillus sepulcri]